MRSSLQPSSAPRPRRPWRLSGAAVVLAGLLPLVAGGSAHAAVTATVQVHIGQAAGIPGQRVPLAVWVSTGGSAVASLSNDIQFPPGITVAARPNGRPDCTVNPEIDKPATAFAFLPPDCEPGVTCTGMRAIVLSLVGLDPIPDGATLYTCAVDLPAGDESGDFPVTSGGVDASDAHGAALEAGGTDGTIRIVETLAVAVDIGSGTVERNRSVAIDVTLRRLDPESEAPVAVEHVIGFDPAVHVARAADGRPDCHVNPELNKPATTFAFQPPACTPGTTCTAVRALVMALDNVDPIAAGSRLYTCRFRAAPTAAIGPHGLVATQTVASDATGTPLASSGTDGAIEVIATCTGDCDASGDVGVNELVGMVNIALGDLGLAACPAGDADGDGEVTINEVIAAVGNALNDCP